MVIISAGEYQKLGFITFKTIGEKYNSKLDKIEYVLDKIHKDEILTHKYYLFGCEAGYERVLTKNIGYVPFAGFVNALGSLSSSLFDLFVLCFSWAGEKFMLFLSILIMFYLFFFVVKLFILLKELILRWF